MDFATIPPKHSDCLVQWLLPQGCACFSLKDGINSECLFLSGDTSHGTNLSWGSQKVEPLLLVDLGAQRYNLLIQRTTFSTNIKPHFHGFAGGQSKTPPDQQTPKIPRRLCVGLLPAQASAASLGADASETLEDRTCVAWTNIQRVDIHAIHGFLKIQIAFLRYLESFCGKDGSPEQNG